MAEKLISPGVFTNEIDQTFLPAAVADIGAALIGPTVKGPAGVPTVVTSYSDFQNKFGDVFKSGSDSVQFLTSHAAEQYLQNSDSLTVVRILDGTFSPATANVPSITPAATATFTFSDKPNEDTVITLTDFGGNSETFVIDDDANSSVSGTKITQIAENGGGATGTAIALDALINASSTISITSVRDGNKLTLTQDAVGAVGNKTITSTLTAGAFSVAVPAAFSGGGSDTAFTLKTLADGSIMNNADTGSTTNNLLTSGSIHNLRFEVSNVSNKKGTFTLSIRRGDDNQKRKQTLETFTGVNLDPNSPNYIGKVVGDQRQTVRTDGTTTYLELSGSFPNKSKFVTVESILNTIDYLDENGNVRVPAASQSLPLVGSGSSNGGFSGGADGFSGFDALGSQNGTLSETVNFYENIGTQTQGFKPDDITDAEGGAAYSQAIDLLANQDEFDINLILAPGLIHNVHSPVTNKIIDTCENRGDCFAIIDPVVYAKNPSDAVTEAESVDSNFAAMYYPWVKVPDSQVAGTQRWVPPSVVLGGIYAFNDRVAHPWFAPAGLNRGGITIATQAQRKLTQGERDTLYDANVNPIATFPGQGVTVFGQKTLQKKASALDRINVRRLLIRVKKFVASSSRFLVFEQNTAATRRRFLGIVNPFLEQVQSQSGLSAFRVVMDETNNTPDTIDRNQLVGQLFLQPTRTAEFVVLDFTIQPTGASFPE